ncbi:hypothetical protein LOOC260_103640 [Paucilactobacillus hokkaidonensis JCM 18461]|uniref:DUF72 domain-containing protein n=2 Tax=Paucilactobacillus hokkaidonensis TaxID=1193095 RepID=A0A0A1GVQ2_9LACO|nr:DUF72 domain-containing protein [Paucilactobacillus hokkaidonensis]KRO09681.1 hypothetical protein IV59_GL000439 [Paucilactobacillus hokkaidonensis]BAP84938.1 hypothetical protein LOOC260_103640 [Paucilactobacillus hokkaidonensis JCM 18461]
MITIGLTTWSDHPSLIKEQRPVQLTEYAAFFPVVEIDNPFYGVPTAKAVTGWQKKVPDKFQFILKANREMTKHPAINKMEPPLTERERRQVFENYRRMVDPLVKRHQLKTILFQFPPFFNATTGNIEYLQQIRAMLPSLPISVEFRNQTWFDAAIFKVVRNFLQELNMTLVVVDEPQQGANSAPLKLAVTNSDLVMFRLHGQNTKGWSNPDREWRKTRTLYRYDSNELKQFEELVKQAESQAKEVCIIFNNNSGHDAADNALQLQKLLGIKFKQLAQRAPEQLDLF